MRKPFIALLVIAMAAGVATSLMLHGETASTNTFPPESYDDYYSLMDHAGKEYSKSLGGPAFDRFLALLPQDADRDLYFLEGDYAMSRHEVGEYLKWLVSDENAAPPNNGELILGKLPSGRLDRFGPSERTIKLWVNAESFPAQFRSRAADLHAWLTRAADDWNSVCLPCKVDILVDRCNTPSCAARKKLDIEVVFSATSPAIAEAPFPFKVHEYRAGRNPFQPRLLVSKRLFDGSSAAGPLHIVRHELGHVLGYRHENIHKKTTPGACVLNASGEIQALGSFDRFSLMYVQCDTLAPAKPLPRAINGFSDSDRRLHRSKEYYGL